MADKLDLPELEELTDEEKIAKIPNMSLEELQRMYKSELLKSASKNSRKLQGPATRLSPRRLQYSLNIEDRQTRGPRPKVEAEWALPDDPNYKPTPDVWLKQREIELGNNNIQQMVAVGVWKAKRMKYQVLDGVDRLHRKIYAAAWGEDALPPDEPPIQ